MRNELLGIIVFSLAFAIYVTIDQASLGKNSRVISEKESQLLDTNQESLNESLSDEANRRYLEEFLFLYQDGSGVNERWDYEALPIDTVTDSLLLEIHKKILDTFDSIEKNDELRTEQINCQFNGEEYLGEKPVMLWYIMGECIQTLKPKLRQAKTKYGIEN